MLISSGELDDSDKVCLDLLAASTLKPGGNLKPDRGLVVEEEATPGLNPLTAAVATLIDGGAMPGGSLEDIEGTGGKEGGKEGREDTGGKEGGKEDL